MLRLNLVGANGEKLADDDDGEDQERLVKLTTDWKLEPIEPILMRYKAGIWERCGTVAEVRAEGLTECLMAAVEQSPGLTAHQLADKVRVRLATVREALQRLKNEEKLRCAEVPSKSGKGRRGEGWYLFNSVPSIGFQDGNEMQPLWAEPNADTTVHFVPDREPPFGNEMPTKAVRDEVTLCPPRRNLPVRRASRPPAGAIPC